MQNRDTSWQAVNKWYDQTVGELGHYYHQQIVLPNSLRLLDFKKNQPSRLLDLACGQGVLSRRLPPWVDYHGIDQSRSLIKAAKQYNHPPHHHFSIGDICQPFPLNPNEPFTHCTILLALQNIEEPSKVFFHLSKHLQPGGKCLIVLNHPCFRIPRQSSWGIDEAQKMQYRRINQYLSPLKIPIQMKPSDGVHSENTWSFHHSLSDYSTFLFQNGFSIDLIEEWISDKTSSGKNASMENRARKEFPLFLAILASKNRKNL